LYLCKNIVFQTILIKCFHISIDYFYGNAIYFIILHSFLPRKLSVLSNILLLIPLFNGLYEGYSIYFVFITVLSQFIQIQILLLLINLNGIKKMKEGIHLFSKELPLPIFRYNQNLELEDVNSNSSFIESNHNFTKMISIMKLNESAKTKNHSEILNFNLTSLFHKFILYFEIFDIRRNSEIQMKIINSPQKFCEYFNKILIQKLTIDNSKFFYMIFLSKNETTQNELAYNDIKNTLLLKFISHELRTPINGTLGGLAILKNLLPHDAILHYNIAEKSTLLLLNTINCMVDYASIEAGYFKINKRLFEVSDLLNELQVIFQDKARLAKINFDIQNKLLWKCEISSDMDRIKQVLIQIIQNAFQYTQKGYVCIECQHDLKSSIKFLVSDSGIGMTNNHLKMIFDKNDQLLNFTGDEQHNNMFGLGWKTAIKILNKLDSELIILSKIGEGTMVSFSINNVIISNKEERNTVEILKSSRNYKRLTRRKSWTIFNNIHKSFEVVDSRNEGVKIVNKDYSKMQSVKVDFNDKGNLSPMFLNHTNKEEKDEIPNEEDIETHFKTNFLNESIKSHIFKQTKPMDSGSKIINKRRMNNNKLSFTSLCEIIQNSKKSEFIKLNHIISVEKTTILIVDDEPFNRYILSELILKHDDLEVIEASNGLIAVEKVKENSNRIKLIFMDLLMPIMDGYQATKLIKKISIKSKLKIPIIAVTSFSADSEKAKCLEAGIDEFLNKPMTVEKLNMCLDKYIYYKEKVYD